MRLALTRPLEQSKSLKKKLEALGFEVVCLPLIEISPPSDNGIHLKKAIQEISKYQWLVFTSQHAVKAVAQYLDKIPPHLKILVIGPKTAQAVKDFGWKVNGLLESLEKQKLKGQKVLYPRSSIGLDKWVRALQDSGAKVDVIEAYQTRESKVSASELNRVIKNGVDAILFFSPSAVLRFTKLCDRKLASKLRLIPFGPTTAKALEDNGFKAMSLEQL